jgi:hypothetical protein
MLQCVLYHLWPFTVPLKIQVWQFSHKKPQLQNLVNLFFKTNFTSHRLLPVLLAISNKSCQQFIFPYRVKKRIKYAIFVVPAPYFNS